MSTVLRPFAAALVAAATVLGALVLVTGAAAPAQAAACTGPTGVTVVVDFNSLGGGVQGACVAGGGGDKASDLLPAAGFPLSYASRQPGFVCRVSGVPQADPCVNTAPADAYWGLWWSDGENGRWTYSSLGAGSLRVPDGGYVAFAWDDVSGQRQPAYTPVVRAAPAPTQTPQPSPPQTQQPAPPSPQPSTAAPATPQSPAPAPTDPAATDPAAPATSPTTGEPSTAPASPTQGPTDRPTRRPRPAAPQAVVPAPEASSPAELADPVAPTSGESVAEAAGGVPTWLALLVALLLFAIAGVVLLLKRRQAGP